LRKTGKLRLARNVMVAVCMILALLSLAPIMLFPQLTLPCATIALSLGFFFSEMTIGPMWAIPMDVAPEHAGTASGIMNMGSAGAAMISPVIGGWIIDRTGDWNLPFVVSMGLMLLGAGLSFMMRTDRKLSVA
jgi:MFS family permease